jgi:predicted transcriptional regulator
MGEKLLNEVTGEVTCQITNEVIAATGLPKDTISKELNSLLDAAGIDRRELTLDDLRAVLAEYVQDVLVAAKELYSETPQD